jgi:sugar phosphate isomerase/epimerase
MSASSGENGKRDNHGVAGEGDINFPAVMTAMRTNHATGVMEVKTLHQVMKSIQALKSIQEK